MKQLTQRLQNIKKLQKNRFTYLQDVHNKNKDYIKMCKLIIFSVLPLAKLFMFSNAFEK